MAIIKSKRFLRAMAQPFEQSSKSLWGIEQIEERQAGGDPTRSDVEMGGPDDDDDEFGGLDDEHFLHVDLSEVKFPALPMVSAY